MADLGLNNGKRRIREGDTSIRAKQLGRQRFRTLLMDWSLPVDLFDDLLDRHVVLNLPRNTLIFQRGAFADVVYWLKAGLVDILYRQDQKKGVLIDIATPGDILGFADFLDVGSRRQLFDARARTRCEIGIVTRDRISLALSKLPPESLVVLAERINGWWAENLEHWVKFCRMDTRERLACVFDRLAEKCGAEVANGRLIVPELGHHDFALLTGSSRPLVTRILAELVAQGHLTRRERQYILHKSARSGAGTPVARGLASKAWVQRDAI
jgi:CRP-like cAMP-binding protein